MRLATAGLILFIHYSSSAQTIYEVVRDAKRDDKTYYYYSVDCSDKNNCTAVGRERTAGLPLPNAIIIERTTDGGTTWHFQNSGLDNLPAFNSIGYLRKVDAIDSLNVVIAGDSGRILRTTDAGNTWSRQESTTLWDIQDISFSDSLNGMAVLGGAILTTTNAGATWSAVPNMPNAGYYQCKAFSSLEQRAVTHMTAFTYSTSDGWNTWHRGDSVADDESGGAFWRLIGHVNFLTQQIVLASGAHHTPGNPDVFHNAFIVRSEDGGKTWTDY